MYGGMHSSVSDSKQWVIWMQVLRWWNSQSRTTLSWCRRPPISRFVCRDFLCTVHSAGFFALSFFIHSCHWPINVTVVGSTCHIELRGKTHAVVISSVRIGLLVSLTHHEIEPQCESSVIDWLFDNLRVMVTVWRLSGNIIRTALCWIVWHNLHSPQHTYVSSSYRSNRLGLSHWDPYAVRRGSCLELYYCNMVEWFWWDSSLIFDDELVSFSALTLLVWSSGL